MNTHQYTFVNGPAGRLECLIDPINNSTKNRTLAIICHPHPLYSGTLHNKVVHTAHKACNNLNIPAIRFNYRGVGKSEGSYGNSIGEIEDLLAIIHWAKQEYCYTKLCLIGFSFGSFIAASGATKTKTDLLISIAPAVTNQDYQQLKKITIPWIIIQGLDDEVIDSNTVINYFNSLIPPPIIETFAETSHFFHGKLVDLKNCLIKYLKKVA